MWVHQLRKSGDPTKRERVNALLEAGEAAWFAPIRLELWRGVTNDSERKALRRYEAPLPDYGIAAETWTRAIQVADRGRAAVVIAPLAGLLILRARSSTILKSPTRTSTSTRWRSSRREPGINP
jgi:hypothetical protein